MNEKTEIKNKKNRSAFGRKIASKAARKIKARTSTQGIWFGLGMMGLIGWSVVIPTILGAAIGLWIDDRYPGNQSWTLMLLIIGLVIGCVNAWHWVTKEEKEMKEEQENNNE